MNLLYLLFFFLFSHFYNKFILISIFFIFFLFIWKQQRSNLYATHNNKHYTIRMCVRVLFTCKYNANFMMYFDFYLLMFISTQTNRFHFYCVLFKIKYIHINLLDEFYFMINYIRVLGGINSILVLYCFFLSCSYSKRNNIKWNINETLSTVCASVIHCVRYDVNVWIWWLRKKI